MAEGKELIFELIPKIMADIGAIGKDQQNKGKVGFKYRGIDDIYNSLNKHLANHGVFSVPEQIDLIVNEPIQSKGGATGWRIINKYHWRFYASDGSSFKAESIGEAIDYGDKASNCAASVAHKYAYLNVFSIPTEDDKDPDKRTHDIQGQQRQNSPPQQQNQGNQQKERPIGTIWGQPDKPASQGQIGFLMGALARNNYQEDDLKQYMQEKLGLTSRKQLTNGNIQQIEDMFRQNIPLNPVSQDGPPPGMMDEIPF